MNEIFLLLETLSTAGRLCLWALFVVSMGFLLFDRRPKKIAGEYAEPQRKRQAA